MAALWQYTLAAFVEVQMGDSDTWFDGKEMETRTWWLFSCTIVRCIRAKIKITTFTNKYNQSLILNI
jgi:hypothetical protein